MFASGPLGAAATALHALRQGAAADRESARRLHRPVPRLREGLAAASGGARAMIDLSDGLATDLGHLCEASRVGVRVEAAAIPVAHGAELADVFAGDDYELCFTAPDATSVARAFAASGCAPPTRIGTIIPDGRVLVAADGTERSLPDGGWEHTVP